MQVQSLERLVTRVNQTTINMLHTQVILVSLTNCVCSLAVVVALNPGVSGDDNDDLEVE